jgi:hypothetical protein
MVYKLSINIVLTLFEIPSAVILSVFLRHIVWFWINIMSMGAVLSSKSDARRKYSLWNII